MSKKTFLLAVLSLVVMVFVAACSPAQAPASQEAAPAQPTAKPAVEPTAEPTVVEPTVEPTPVVNAFGECDDPLILWHGLTGSDGAIFAELLQKFSADNPDVCLNSEGYPWDLFFQKYPTAVAAGTPPDLVIFHASEVKQMASLGMMIPLDDIIYNDGTFSRDDFNPTLIKAITIDGKTMALPFDNHGWLLWYNTELIKNAGLDPENLPKNGEEFIAWAQKLTTDVNGKHPNEAGFDKDNVEVWAIDFTWPRYTVPTTLWQFGGSVISDDGTKATLASPESIAAIQFWHDLMYKYYVAPPNTPGKTWSGDLYRAGRLVFMWEGTWMRGFMRDNPEIAAKTKTAFINSLAPDGNQAVKFDSHIFSIPTGVDKEGIAKAKKLMTYLVKNSAYWATSGQVPALLSVQQSPEVQALSSVATAADEFNTIGRTDMDTKAFIEIQTAYETAIGSALLGPDASVEEALKAGNEQIQAILDRP